MSSDRREAIAAHMRTVLSECGNSKGTAVIRCNIARELLKGLDEIIESYE